MTCEVVVLNRLGLALAADSAITFTEQRLDHQATTFASGANKIFQLTQSSPVGAMVFNNANLQGVPWELVVKSFRADFGSNRLHLISDYAKSFTDFISGHSLLFSKSAKEAEFKKLCARASLLLIEQIRSLEPTLFDLTKQADHEAAWDRFVATALSWLAQKPLPSFFVDTDIEEASDTFGAWLSNEILKYISNSPDTVHLSTVISGQQAALLAIEGVFKLYEQVFGDSYTGVVIAGYGEDEYFPAYVELKIYGFVLDKLAFEFKSAASVDQETSSNIVAFATTAMVETFMQGISPSAWWHAQVFFKELVEQACSEILGVVGAVSTSQQVEAIVEKAKNNFIERWSRQSLDAHYWPLRNVISGLAVEELAELAETLVVLESLKEKVTSRTQSVGGPVDVAVITKAEGLVWIKRKLYFKAELNHRYFQRLPT